MARNASDAKMGFYPIPPEVIDAILTHLEPQPLFPGERVMILDPCAGKGAAIAQLGEGLNCEPSAIHAIELDAGRGEAIRELLPDATILTPASFLATAIRPVNSFSLVYCNPPFSDELGGGGREETTFLERATWHIRGGGTLVLVLPFGTFSNYTESSKSLRQHLDVWYDNVEAFDFPASIRRFKEIVIFATRRKSPRQVKAGEGRWSDKYTWYSHRGFPVIGSTGHRWPVLAGRDLKVFDKTDYTSAEFHAVIANSPLNSRLRVPENRELPSPPLSLTNGHVGLLLAAGELNGLVKPPGETAHVVRGTSRKVRFLKERTESTDEDGKKTVKEVYSERIVPLVRAVWHDGNIRTLE